MKITYCPPAESAGDALDDVVYFIRCGVPPSTARLLARAYRDASCPDKMSDALWDAIKAFTQRHNET
jgi:hypothetical protein